MTHVETEFPPDVTASFRLDISVAGDSRRWGLRRAWILDQADYKF
jgi:hypothetical protein